MSRSYSRGKMTIGPKIKAQLPKINFTHMQQEQQVMDDILHNLPAYKDTRELASNIINQKNKEEIDRSFDEQQLSYGLLKERMTTANHLLNTKVIQKSQVLRINRSQSRQGGQSMIMTGRDESLFQWMDELYRKNQKSNIPKPARNPQKIQEILGKNTLPMRPHTRQISHYEKSSKQIVDLEDIDENEMSFEIQGLNTNKNLKNYDCWDEEKTPQEIVQYFKDDSSYHGKSPHFINNIYTWTEVQILDYDEKLEKFKVVVLRNTQTKYVGRLSLLLKNENEQNFKKRLAQCKRLQKQAEEELRFFKLVNSLNDIEVSELSKEQKEKIRLKLKQQNQRKGLVKDLFEQVEFEYKLFMKKFYVLMNIPLFDFKSNRIKIRYVRDILMKIPPKRQLIKKDFKNIVNQLEQVYFLNNNKVIKGQLKLTERIEQKEIFRLIVTQYGYGQQPFSLSNLDTINQQTYSQQKLSIMTNWRSFIIQDLQDILRNTYNCYQTDQKIYNSGSLSQLFRKLDYIFTHLSKELVVISNIEQWLQHIRQFVVPQKEGEYWKIAKEPLLELNITAINFHKKKTIIGLKKSTHEENVMQIEPTRQQIISILANPLDLIKETIKSLYRMEKDLVPLLDIEDRLAINLEDLEELFQNTINLLIEYIDIGLQEPLKVLHQFNQHSSLFTRSSNYLIKKLFGELREKQNIMNLELKNIQEKLLFYRETINQIQTICIDERSFQFFQLKTKQAKTILFQKAQEIMNIILQKLAECVTDNINRIQLQYQEMCEKIVQQPNNETEMIFLKNYIAEAEINLAKIKNEVNKISECLSIMETFQYQYDTKQIENFWLLKQWPGEIRIALVEGQRNVAAQEMKFTEKLDNEKEQFVRELFDIELAVNQIKRFDNYSQVKESATGVMSLKEKIVFAQDLVKSFNERESLFKQPLSEYEDLAKLSAEFEPYYKIWDLAMEFDLDKQEWYQGGFLKLNFPPVERKVIVYLKEINKLNKHFNDIDDDKALSVLGELKKDVERFKEIMFLIEYLTCEAIQKKPQIWNEIFQECNIIGFDEITLQGLLDCNMQEHRQKLYEISKKATHQWEIEKKLNQVMEKTREIKLEFLPYQGTFILKSIDEIQQQLDDQLNMLIILKSSPYIKNILNKANQVEQRLILLQDTLEYFLKTQRGWMYLEPIFQSDDINKKLPSEKQKFESVDKYWRTTIEYFYKDPFLWDGIDNEKYKQESKHCNDLLEQISLSLSDYLESKRKVFPRFFFLPDEGLLEILAQTKDPQTVQKHIRKCFEGINQLEFEESDLVTQLISPEGEQIRLHKPVNVVDGDKRGNVEKWLLEIEYNMVETLKRLHNQCLLDSQSLWSDWLLKWPSQCVLVVNMIRWTSNVEQILTAQVSQQGITEYVIPTLSHLLAKINQEISQVVSQFHKPLSQQQRTQLSSLIVLHVHNRDTIIQLDQKEKLLLTDYEWLMQLRYYCTDPKKINIQMLIASVSYGFEYLGNTTRLVITPLTDRCQRTLLGALVNNYGGAPEGPAGTGKTETVKDLSKAVAMPCVVFNCSDGLSTASMSKFFKGLATSGAWCCFDEFNRIELEVLSVIASQMVTIQTAIRERRKIFFFETDEYNLVGTCCINITMNPGYAGRWTLPENLKALFRPCAMMIPDYKLIAEIFLYSVGFQEAKSLATKVAMLLKLSADQLSSQDHYDFGMRALKAILSAAGQQKRMYPTEREEIVCLRALRDVNMPKLVVNDIKLFLAIATDLFPNMEMPKNVNDLNPLVERIDKLGLQGNEGFIEKCVQLQDTINVRHGVMLLGDTFSGKSSVLEVTNLDDGCSRIIHKLNPKALTNDQLYGKLDPDTKTYDDGVIAMILRNCLVNKFYWIIFDGPVDALWIENMNTVLDDNKKLCLSSGEIIQLSNTTTMIFEVGDLIYASPATVSRCGMIYMQPIGWSLLLDSFCKREQLTDNLIQRMIWLFDSTLGFIQSKFLIYQSEMAIVAHTLRMLGTYLPCKNEDQFGNILLFCVVWSIGGTLERELRIALNQFLLKLITSSQEIIEQHQVKLLFPFQPFAIHLRYMEPTKNPDLFELCFEPNKNVWISWVGTQPPFQIPTNVQYHELDIQCNDSIQNQYWINRCVVNKIHILIAGPTGTGKTMCIQSALKQFGNDVGHLRTNLNGQTSAKQLQQLIEGRITQRRRKGHYGPEENKSIFGIFIDDLNMPRVEQYGAQPPIELLRQWMDTNGWYDLENKEFKYLEDIVFIGGMLPGHQITTRFLRHFRLLYTPTLNNDCLHRIFGCINQWIIINWSANQTLNKQVQNISNYLVKSTLQLFHRVQKEMLPTPLKSHYTYNLRDIWKVFQGIQRGNIKMLKNEDDLINLWQHECCRVFSDRLCQQDLIKFDTILEDVIKKELNNDYILTHLSFMQQSNNQYIQVEQSIELEQYLNEYNTVYTNTLDLLLFNYAVQHILRIVRVLQTHSGHMLLMGIAGSGRKTLSQLATYIAIETEILFVNPREWEEEMESILKLVGIDTKMNVLFLNDVQLSDTMIEQVCNFLNVAEIPSLFVQERKLKLMEELSQLYTGSPQEKYAQFISNCKSNLHFVIAMNPINQSFRVRLRDFPALVNCTTIDYFHPWPEEALQTTAEYHIPNLNLPIVKMHQIAIDESQEYFNTPTDTLYQFYQPHYLTFLNTFNTILLKRTNYMNLQIERYTSGVEKILATESDVSLMQVTLQDLQPKLQKSTLENSQMLINLQKKQKEADQKKHQCQTEENQCQVQRQEANQLRQDCQQELDKVLPLLAAASQALEKISNEDMVQLKSFQKPPQAVLIVMEGLCYVYDEEKNVKWRPKEPGSLEKVQDFWEYSKKHLLNDKLIKKVKDFKEDQIKGIGQVRIGKIKNFLNNPLFEKEKVFNASKAAGNLSLWIRAVVNAFDAFQVVDPKKSELKSAVSKLDLAEKELNEKKQNLSEILKFLQILEDEYQQAKDEKEQLELEVSRCRIQLDRAEKLINGLATEKESWKWRANQFKQQCILINNDCILASGIITYFGAFPKQFRLKVLSEWQQLLGMEQFNLQQIMSDPVTIGVWTNQQKLPNDQLSIENAIIIENSSKWCLLVDPQNQGNQWLKLNQEVQCIKKYEQLYIENCITLGLSLILENIGEDLDSSYNQLLQKQIVGNQIKFGDKYVDIHPNFRFFVSTKLSRPQYKPEVCINVTILNFAVTQQGLEDQLLNILVKMEDSLREEQRIRNVREYYENKQKQRITEDAILKLLNCEGNVLEDENLIETLQKSKFEQLEIEERLKKSEYDQQVFKSIRNQYRSAAKKVSEFYAVIQELQLIEPIYCWSLEAYISLYEKAIRESKRENRNQAIYLEFIKLLYTYISKALLEKDKLIFSFLMLLRSMLIENNIKPWEIRFFTIGSTNQQISPNVECTLNISQEQWKTLNDFAFQIDLPIERFVQQFQQWQEYLLDDSQLYEMPIELPMIQKLQLIKIFKPHLVIQAIQVLIEKEMGSHFVTSIPFDINHEFDQSIPSVPIFFILAPGADPRVEIQNFADRNKIKMIQISLGQGQGIKAELAIKKAIVEGQWVLLQNCQLALSFMKDFERIQESHLCKLNNEIFRLFLTSTPSTNIPQSLLQFAQKITFQQPSGIKNHLLKVYGSQDKNFDNQTYEYKKLLFGLSLFHSVVQERIKFGPIGWNVAYEFSQADFTITHMQLKQEIQKLNSNANENQIQNMISLFQMIMETNYGGRVTSPQDRKLLNVLLKQFCNPEILLETHRFTDIHYAPVEGTLQSFQEKIAQLSQYDSISIFGLHSNAAISGQIIETKDICTKLSRVISRTSVNKEIHHHVRQLSASILDSLPPQFEINEIILKFPMDYLNSMNTVLIQELMRFNRLTISIKESLQNLIKAIDGILVMSSELDEISNYLFDNMIPRQWITYPTQKPLGSYIENLCHRLQYFANWIRDGPPPEYNISYFYFTQSFLTGVQQNYARKYAIPIDTLDFEFTYLDFSDKVDPPTDGCIIYGLQFDQAQWDLKQSCLVPPQILQLYSPCPKIWMLPSQNHVKPLHTFEMPVYRTIQRSGTLSTTGNSTNYIISIHTPIKDNENEWVKRGAALIAND